MGKNLGPVARRDWVHAVKAGGKAYLYYRREDRREKLPGPEGSAAFLAAYDRVHGEFEGKASAWGSHTVDAVIGLYRASADFRGHSPATRRLYGHYLDELSGQAGAVSVLAIGGAWAEGLRDRLGGDAIRWNKYRSLLTLAWDRYRREHPDLRLDNPWKDTRRLKVEDSDQNRAWPEDVLVSVFREATSEFRGLLTCQLLTAQRIGDVCALPEAAYDPEARTLAFVQGKTGAAMCLRVPDVLGDVFKGMRGRVPGRLLCTPRGKAWTEVNAQETLLSLRARLGIQRYVLHGLRATGPSAAYQDGVDLRSLMAITGHTTESNIKKYLRWVVNAPLAAKAGQVIEARFLPTLGAALEGANKKSYSGTTGRAAAKAGVVGSSRRKAAGNAE